MTDAFRPACRMSDRTTAAVVDDVLVFHPEASCTRQALERTAYSRARDNRQTDTLDGAVSRTLVAVGIEMAWTADATLSESMLAKVSEEA